MVMPVTGAPSWTVVDDEVVTVAPAEAHLVRGDDTMPSVERASADSTKRQREALLDQLTILKEENRRLREEVARAYGQQRASAW